jgi:hypothetical protein
MFYRMTLSLSYGVDTDKVWFQHYVTRLHAARIMLDFEGNKVLSNRYHIHGGSFGWPPPQQI